MFTWLGVGGYFRKLARSASLRKPDSVPRQCLDTAGSMVIYLVPLEGETPGEPGATITRSYTSISAGAGQVIRSFCSVLHHVGFAMPP